jgi:uncharacterized protein (TIRG00374 family)|tara:strand:+ start:340 stop:1293 length:954 start_codon:yes stop_codon:yes gene_type:complete
MFKIINTKNTINLIFGLTFFVFALKFLNSNVNINEVYDSSKNIFLVVITGYFFFCLHVIANFLRWIKFLKLFNPNINTKYCYEPFFISVALNYALPIKIGDGYRILKNSDKLLLNKKEIFACVILERLIDFSVLFFLFFLGLFLYYKNSFFHDHSYNLVVFLTIIFFLAILFIWLTKKAYIKFKLERFEYIKMTYCLIFNKKIIQIILITLLSWIFEIITFYLLFKFIFLDVSISKILLSHSGAILSIALPSGPGLIGPIDYTLSGFFNFFAFEKKNIFIFITVFHFYIFLTFFLIFVSWLSKNMLYLLKNRTNTMD